MKKIVLVSALLFAVTALSAREKSDTVKLYFWGKPTIRFETDTVQTKYSFTVPPEMDRRQLFHRFEIWVVSASDTTDCRKLYTVNAVGPRRERFNRRQRRREGLPKEKLAWSKKHNPRSKKNKGVYFSLAVKTPNKDWIEGDGPGLIRIDQFQSLRLKDPVALLCSEYFEPRILEY